MEPESTKPSEVFLQAVEADVSHSMAVLLDSMKLPRNLTSICIKLNLCEYRMAETGCTSDPAVVNSLLENLRGKYPSSRIVLIEGDSTNTTAETLFPYLGIDSVAKRFNCETMSISKSDWVRVKIEGMRFKSVHVPKVLTECDLYITHPKLKTHSLTKISCSLKNQFGCLRPKNKVPFHNHIDEAIVDANLARRPDITIVDANICMEGIGGPIHGRPRRLGLFMGGRDLVAVDSLCAKVVGFRPFFIGHVRKSANYGLGHMRFQLTSGEGKLPQKKLAFDRLQYYALRVLRGRLR